MKREREKEGETERRREMEKSFRSSEPEFKIFKKYGVTEARKIEKERVCVCVR